VDQFKAMIAQVNQVYPDFRISNDGSACPPR